MKKNNKGFLLAETIVTVCIIATLATSSYLYVSRTASRFEERNNYENVVDVYKVNTLKQYLEKTGFLTTDNINTLKQQLEAETGNDNIDFTDENLANLKTELNIQSAYIILNKDAGKNSIATSDKAFKDYIKWLNVDGDTNLRLIVWFEGKDGEDGTFANIKINTPTS